jgi:hypothetical protein
MGKARRAATSADPPALLMAPSTPLPYMHLWSAALTIASPWKLTMLPCEMQSLPNGRSKEALTAVILVARSSSTSGVIRLAQAGEEESALVGLGLATPTAAAHPTQSGDRTRALTRTYDTRLVSRPELVAP